MKETFIEWKPSTKTGVLLTHVIALLEDFDNQGYVLTLRQLYYQLVAKDIIANNIKEYSNLGRIVSKGRLAGFIDWSMIEDRMRNPSANSHWNTGAEILESAARGFYMDRWEDQDVYIEVWCEKDAVSNIITPICRKWDVLFMANRGYSSQSAMYNAYNRYDLANRLDKRSVLVYLGDHDPSGMDMTRDVENRLFTFGLGNIEVDRIALNMSQINQYQPPQNPTKLTDSRSASYVTMFGDASWELDALSPAVLSQIVEKSILDRIDMNVFDEVVKEESEIKDRIKKVAKGF